MQDRRAVLHREARGAVGHDALALGLADRLAEVGLGMQAVVAFPALGRVKRDDVVALLHAGHTGADLDHDARAFVAEDRGEGALGVGARQREFVGMADAGGLQFHHHLAGPRAFEVHLHDLKRLPGLDRDGCAGFHGISSLSLVAADLASCRALLQRRARAPSSRAMKQTLPLLFAALTLVACAPASDGPNRVPLTGTCDAAGYSAMVGLNIAAVTLPADLEQRVIYPGQAVTMDFRPNRMNIEVSETGTIRRIYCG